MFLLYIHHLYDWRAGVRLVGLFSTKEKLEAYIDKHPLTETTKMEYCVKEMEVDPVSYTPG